MSVTETLKKGCGCQLSLVNGQVIIQPCNSAQGVTKELVDVECEFDNDPFGDLDIFIRPLMDFFRYGGGLKHDP